MNVSRVERIKASRNRGNAEERVLNNGDAVEVWRIMLEGLQHRWMSIAYINLGGRHLLFSRVFSTR